MDHQDHPDPLQALPLGDVRVVVAGDVRDALGRIEEVADRSRCPFAALGFSSAPGLDEVLDAAVAGVAAVASQTWPGWREHRDARVPAAWRREAEERAGQGRPPAGLGVPRALEVAGLAEAIGADRLLVVLALEFPAPAREALLGLARAAEWIAREAACRTALLVPRESATAAALEPLLFQRLEAGAWLGIPDPPPPPAPTVRIGPLAGRPHPLSPGERALWAALERDPALRGLFACNAPVDTVRGSQHRVDLLWGAGRLVVEVDGYEHHGGRHAFQADRHRDYELSVSGYLVLRLTHDEVVRDPALALEKVRDCVDEARRRGWTPS